MCYVIASGDWNEAFRHRMENAANSYIIEIQDHIIKKLKEENQQLRDEVVRLLKAIRKKMLRATKCHDLKPLTKLNVQQSKRL